MLSFVANTVAHPIQTYSDFVIAIQMLSDLAKQNQWKEVSEIIFPEICELVNQWNMISPRERGEKTGYIVGKYGADILIPSAAIKAVAKGIKGAKEVLIIAKNLKNSEKVVELELLANTGFSSESFKEFIYSNRISTGPITASTEKLIEGFSIEKLAEAGKVLDKAGLTKAGRALAKHGGREQSVFPKAVGNPEQINLEGQKILESILNNPNSKITNLGEKGFKIYDPEGKGLFYYKDGTLRGFIEAQYE